MVFARVLFIVIRFCGVGGVGIVLRLFGVCRFAAGYLPVLLIARYLVLKGGWFMLVFCAIVLLHFGLVGLWSCWCCF